MGIDTQEDSSTTTGDARRAELIARESKKPGFKGIIAAKCIECVFDPYSPGNWRQQVQSCTVEDCPLYRARPTSKPKGRADAV